MKQLKLVVAILTLTAAVSAFASEQITSTTEDQVSVGLIEGFNKIPATGALTGSVVTVYRGSAIGLTSFLVTVGNSQAECEGDDCLITKTFELAGFKGTPQGVYSRKVDANTYSIAVIGNKVVGIEDGQPVTELVKVLLRVKFTKTGIEESAEMTETNP